MMAKVYNAMDSISTSARINMFWITPAALGFRAMPSEVEIQLQSLTDALSR